MNQAAIDARHDWESGRPCVRSGAEEKIGKDAEEGEDETDG